MTQQFDPVAFMNATTDSVLDTVRPLLPAKEYPGIIMEVEVKSGTIGKGDRMGETWGGIKLKVELQLDEAAKQVTGRDKATLSPMIMLDLTEEGMLDLGKGKNVDLGKWYEAAGLNIPNQPKSPAMLQGRAVVCLVGARQDANDKSKLFDDIKSVRKPSN